MSFFNIDVATTVATSVESIQVMETTVTQLERSDVVERRKKQLEIFEMNVRCGSLLVSCVQFVPTLSNLPYIKVAP